jgi:hypothetical protein
MDDEYLDTARLMLTITPEVFDTSRSSSFSLSIFILRVPEYEMVVIAGHT